MGLSRMNALGLTVFAGAMVGVALGQAPVGNPVPSSPDTRRIEVTIAPSQIGRLAVSPGVGAHDGSGFTPRACNVLVSHTDANFGGGSFVVQAGFAQTEMFAATYDVPAGEWPIKHNLTEVIVATTATVSTVTEWSLLFYAGEPHTGTLVATYSSNDLDLPHIALPPGTNGVNLSFSIDPGDPEQLVIEDNGSHKFSVAFRIDRHNNQTQNPCLIAPPTNSNAFPVTDVSGLAQPTRNWLFGVNCGPFGCPANGGWSRFSTLPGGCRPSGDWVSRTTWSSLNCTPGVGACCLPDGNCTVATQSDCVNQGGTFQGDGTFCEGRNCPQPIGACCFASGFCLDLSEISCAGAGGVWGGLGSVCGANNTCPTGACCLPLGNCISGVTQAQCEAQAGTFRGVGSACAGANCPQPTGACCLPNGFCLELTSVNCAGIGGTWGGPLTTCADGNGNGRADICEPPNCPADFNGDGSADFFDYDDFVVAFESPC